MKLKIHPNVVLKLAAIALAAIASPSLWSEEAELVLPGQGVSRFVIDSEAADFSYEILTASMPRA